MNAAEYPDYRSTNAQWLDRLPTGWRELRGKWIFRQSRAPKLDNDEQLSATQKYGVVPQSQFMEQEGSRVVLALSGTENFRHVDRDDFVISLRSFQGGIERCHFDGCVSPAYTILKKIRGISEDFFSYLLKCDWFISALQIGITGIREGKNISYDEFGKIILPFPPVAEQTAIARFLDRETSRTDSLIEKKGRFIELLKEKRAAVITHAVTKGLDPNAPLRDSGVEWLGEVPTHWTLSKIGHLFRQRSEKVSDTEYEALSVTKNGILPQKDHVAKTDDNDNRKLVRAGDFVINSRSDRKGSAGVADRDGSVSLINTVLIIRSGLDERYCHHLLRCYAFQEEFYRAGNGLVADLWTTNFSAMKSITVPVPPQGEQKRIARFVDDETVQIDTLIAKTERSIELLREKRSALITAAVTGKIDVRAAA